MLMIRIINAHKSYYRLCYNRVVEEGKCDSIVQSAEQFLVSQRLRFFVCVCVMRGLFYSGVYTLFIDYKQISKLFHVK